MLALFARGVAAEHAEAPRLGILFDERADVAHSDDAECPAVRLPALHVGQVNQRGADPLQHAAGVASGGSRDTDAVCGAPPEVDVVEPDGGRGDHPHAGAGQQPGVAARSGTDDECVGIADVGGRDGLAGDPDHFGEGRQHILQKGYGAVGDDLHGMRFFALGWTNIGKF